MILRKALLCGLAVLLLVGASPLYGAYIFNTGVNNSGALLPSEAMDPHYTVSADGGLTWNPTYVARGANAAEAALYSIPVGWPFDPFTWYVGFANAQWIGPQADVVNMSSTPDPTPYIYRISFDLTNYNLSTVSISGAWAMDNTSSGIYLNGSLIPGTAVSDPFAFHVPWLFNITSGFVQGLNTLDFHVTNVISEAPNPSGLVVSMTGAGVLLIPEPSTFVLLGAGLLVLGVARRRMRAR